MSPSFQQSFSLQGEVSFYYCPFCFFRIYTWKGSYFNSSGCPPCFLKTIITDLVLLLIDSEYHLSVNSLIHTLLSLSSYLIFDTTAYSNTTSYERLLKTTGRDLGRQELCTWRKCQLHRLRGMGTVTVPATVKELLQFTFEERTYLEIELHM